ncbi:helix-turn-helix domain-containing protein [Nitrospira sp. T9]|uniref:helix-turn-helix domain-containing protein n=1 Tax=unclassified Nitrospira TaxID=2652172 RepID=UPI003F96F855
MSQGLQFNPSRLTLARKRRGLTLTRLAAMIGVEQRSMSAYERGEFKPDTEKLEHLGKALRFPVNYFFGDDLEELSPDSASFRALSKMTAGQRDTALGAGAIALLLNKWIEARFELPSADIPNLSQEVSPEAAAISIRQHWGLGELFIKNTVHLLESKGVRVFSLSIDAVEVDAFSMWRVNTPFVFLNTKKSAEHSRFDAAHELGHLVMHRHGAPQGQNAEREANAFASAFLMPRASVLAHAPGLVTVDHLINLKRNWNVSVGALAYRLHAIGVLTDWNYRTLCIEMSSRGYRKCEPEEAQRESSQVLAKVFGALRDEGITKKDIANELRVHIEEIDQLVFGLTLMALKGSGALGGSPTSKRPQLRAVR